MTLNEQWLNAVIKIEQDYVDRLNEIKTDFEIEVAKLAEPQAKDAKAYIELVKSLNQKIDLASQSRKNRLIEIRDYLRDQ